MKITPKPPLSGFVINKPGHPKPPKGEPYYPPQASPCLLAEEVLGGKKVALALRTLLDSIDQGTFSPGYTQTRAEELFTKLRQRYGRDYQTGKGRYEEALPARLVEWEDLLNNVGSVVITNIRYMQDPENPPGEKQEAHIDADVAIRETKAVEDWLYYHPEVRQALAELLK